MSQFTDALNFLTKTTAVLLTALSALFGQPHSQVVVLSPHQSFAASSSAAVTKTATSTSVQLPHITSKITTATKKPAAQQTAVLKPQSSVATSSPAIDPAQLNATARASLVNIFCTTQVGGTFHPISGSGVIIDTRGIILTNAHIGQFFLLRDYPFANNLACVVRTGSPAQPQYTAQLLYLPPEWIDANASHITQEHPTGTGENDYAFLRITGTTNPNGTLPVSFPALPLSAGGADTNENVLLAAYPAGFLDGTTIATNLYASSSYTTVKALFSFVENPEVDLISISGTVVSQSGSSGGAVVDANTGRLLAIIVTDSAGDTTAERDLRAITLLHIDNSLAQSGRGGMANLLNGNLDLEASSFASTTFQSEKEALVNVLDK
jgi:hypothetical protein